jgi:transcriptional antiterminator RfaH
MNKLAIRHSNPTDVGEPAWYCLRSKTKHEHIAAAHLRLLEGVTVFCPRIRFKRVTRQGLVWVTEAMFPSYLFARFELAELHRQVEYAHGVRGIVRFADRYPTIEEGVLAQLRDHVGVKEVKELDYAPSQGDNVRIAEGAFAGLEAVVTQILPAKERVKVLMDFLGRKMEAEVECSSLLRQVAHPLATPNLFDESGAMTPYLDARNFEIGP